MNVTIDNPQFPVIMTVVFDNQDELDRFYCLFNYPPLRAWFGREKAKMIRELLKPLAETYNEVWTGFINVVAPKPTNFLRGRQ